MRKLIIATMAVVTWVAAAGAKEFEIDTAHSQIGFKVKHVTGKVTGRFTTFSGSFSYDPKDVKSWNAQASIDPASINTDNEGRDKHLKSPDFFGVKDFPAMTFKSTGVSDVKEDHATLNGVLFMHGESHPVSLALEIGGVDKDPWGNETAGFTARGEIKRKDWGMTFNKLLDSGNVLVGDKVEIILEIAGNAKKAESPAKGKSKGT